MKEHDDWERMLAQLDGHLDEEQRRRFLAEVANDPARAELLSALQRDWLDLRELPRAEWSKERAAAMLRGVRSRVQSMPAAAERQAARPSASWVERVRWRRFGVAAAILLCAGWIAWRPWKDRSAEPMSSVADRPGEPPSARVPALPAFPADLPACFQDPEFLDNFAVIQDLADLEDVAEVLDLEDESVLFEMVGLELLSGV